MLINSIFAFFQNLSSQLYKKSFLLKNIDLFVFISIVLMILSSAFVQSDYIGFLAFVIIFLTFIKLLVKPFAKIEISKPEIFLIVYFLIMIISLAGSSLFLYSLKGFCKNLVYIGFYFSFVNFLADNKDKLKYILLAGVSVLCFETVIAYMQNFASVSEISGWQDVSRLNPEQIMTRVYGTLKPYNPNLFGGYMLSILPMSLLCLYLPLKNKQYKMAILGLIFFLAGVSTILLTGCRGAYIGLFFEFLAIAVLTYKLLKPVYQKIFLFFSGILSAIAGIAILSVTSLRARIFSIFAMRSDSSNSFRFNVYNSCIEMFKDNWLLGIGVGNQNFREIYGLYMKTGFDALSAYNIYLEMAVESGIFALLAFLAFIFLTIKTAFKNLTNIYVLIALISITGILVHGIVDTVFFRPQIQIIFWIMVGILRVMVK